MKMDDISAYGISPYTLTSYFLETYRDENLISNATCFFIRIDGQLYLITNWHVVSGKNADTFEHLDTKYAAEPNKLRVYLPKINETILNMSNDQYLEFPLFDNGDTKLWMEKKKNDRMIDVAVLPCHEIDKLLCVPINEAEEPFNKNTDFNIASEIYILGFPFASLFGLAPIWKKASVASEPLIDIEGFPYFFADTATRQGMSGSPVILYENRPVTLFDQKENKLSRHKTKFIGIYSGRIGANAESKNDAQLGRVWKADVIKQIIQESKNEQSSI